jgi:predicted GTPase
MSNTIQLALISHTNNGKTTLARTLMGVDVGEVRDAAHVTVHSEPHTLLTTPQGDVLQLWDTPGFGDSVRLQTRLAQAGNPIGWFLREVLDRYRDRPFWLSQQALRAARDSADIVLYLVNSSEDLQDAGYVPAEMKILDWLGKPVVVLLNQTGRPRPLAEEQLEQARWRDHLRQYSAVRDVLALDAFARSWVHERVFYDALVKLLPSELQPAYARLSSVWEARNADRYEQSMQLLATQLSAAVLDSEAMPEEGAGMLKSALKVVGIGRNAAQQRQDQAMGQLVARLNRRTTETTRELLILHQLDPANVAQISEQVREHFAVRAPIDKAQAGLLGAMISGAATGLSADLLAGGLTLGGGALLGGLAGALTFAGAAWGFNSSTDRHQATMQFTDAFMQTLVVAGILRYLAVAHFGRGRGSFVDGEAPAFWQSAVEQVVTQHQAELTAVWKQARHAPAVLQPLMKKMVSATLRQLYPGLAPRA